MSKPRYFTEEEAKAVQAAASAVWQEIAADAAALYTRGRVPKSHAVEMICDASRLEDKIKYGWRWGSREGGNMPLAEKVRNAPIKTLFRLVGQVI